MTVANGHNGFVPEEVIGVPILFQQVKTRLDLFVVQNVLFDLVRGRADLGLLDSVPKYRTKYLRLNYCGQGAALSTVLEFGPPRKLCEDTNSDAITSN